MDCWIFSFLQNSLKVSDVKFLPASEIFLSVSPSSANIILDACTRSFADRLAIFSQLGTYCINLQYRKRFCY